MGRRNISVTHPLVELEFDRADNVSRFIERCVLEHIEREKVEYTTLEDLEQLRGEFKMINKNYEQVKMVLDEIIEMLFKK